MKLSTPRSATIFVLLFLTTRLFAQSETNGSYYTSFDGTKIYYEVKGTGYPVMLIHGYTGTAQGWKNGPLYNDLLKAGFRVIALDQRGNGHSDKPHDEQAYANDAEAKDIIGLMSSLNINQYDAVGYSRGSIILSRLLILDKRLRKGIMGGMGDGYINPNWPRRIHIYQALMGDTSLHDVDEAVKWIHSQPFDVLAMAYQQKYQPVTSKTELAGVRIPVLIVCGSEDKNGNGSETALNSLMPGSRLVYVPGDHNRASHTPEFSAAVLGFLKE